jgi:ABC-2 type transport system permease protein
MFHRASAYIKIAFKDILAYKFAVAIWTIITPITLAVYYFLWKAIYTYAGEAVIRGYTFNELISYFILIQLTGMFVWTNMDQTLSNNIRYGTLVNKLIRPVGLFKSTLLQEIGQTAFVFAVQAAPLLAVGAVFFGLSFTTWPALGLAIISFILSVVLSLTFVFFVGLSAFWLTRYQGVRRVRDGLTWFLGGGVIPLTFFPPFWQKVFSLLPFQYMQYAPVQIYLGKYAGLAALGVMGFQVFWIAIFYLLIRFIWPRAMAHFSAVGG